MAAQKATTPGAIPGAGDPSGPTHGEEQDRGGHKYSTERGASHRLDAELLCVEAELVIIGRAADRLACRIEAPELREILVARQVARRQLRALRRGVST